MVKRTVGSSKASGLVLALLLNTGMAGPAKAALPRLNIEREASNVVVRFSGALQSAVNADGPYETVVGATSPYLRSPTNSQHFWRAILTGVRTFSAGGFHTVALRWDGTLWAWGQNAFDQLGNGTRGGSTNTPQQIGTNADWETVAAGRQHTVALRRDGTLWAWGLNGRGQLGIGTRVPSTNTAQQIGTDTNWEAVATGGSHTLALRADGTLWAWGDNYLGQLGTGRWDLGTNTPQPIATNATWQAVAAVGDISVALRADGTLWTWGLNVSGESVTNTPQQIGTNATWEAVAVGVALRADGTLWKWEGSNNIPRQIGTNANWQAVATGAAHFAALRADGTLWLWGYNGSGQLGNGTFIDANTPERFGTDANWQAVAAGESYTMALRTDGTLWAWGNNYWGQLGNGKLLAPNTPQPIGTNATWEAVAAGRVHSVALRGDGTLWAWGNNGSWQLGDGTSIFFTNAPKQIGTNATWRTIAVGDSHTVALRMDGTLWAWGYNYAGQLGNGTLTSTNTPQPIATNATWQMVAAGGYHTVAVRADGTLWAWGYNNAGQLGNGIVMSRTNSPQQIGTNATWQTVAAGGYYTVALRMDGTLWAWGYNYFGQLGNGTSTTTNTPQAIATNVTWKAVAAGGNVGDGKGHTVALRTDGTLWAWGDNESGQLGDGTLTSKSTPQPIVTNATWQAIAAGSAHTVALRTDGTLWTWGLNQWGQLGNGTFINTNAPQQIGVDASWQAVAAGDQHTLALRADGTLWAWGYNHFGQSGQEPPWWPSPVLGGPVWSLQAPR